MLTYISGLRSEIDVFWCFRNSAECKIMFLRMYYSKSAILAFIKFGTGSSNPVVDTFPISIIIGSKVTDIFT
jgi:hypothetical protein